MLNIWKRYPRRKPKEGGYYLCTIDTESKRYVDILSYSEWADEWVDLSRQRVFDGYGVYSSGRAPIPDNRVRTDRLCNLTEFVVAWKKVPKHYK